VTLDRRALLVRTGAALAAAGLGERLLVSPAAAEPSAAPPSWPAVRAQFRLQRDVVYLGGLLLASHPAAVRRAIERHRDGLDRNPVHYLHGNQMELEARVLREAGRHLGVDPVDVALTDSTTMGLGLLYNGLRLRSGDEIVTTTHDFFATHEALRLKAERSGATVRQVTLYNEPARASEAGIVGAVRRALTARTRVLAVTWVHSSTGVKLPIAAIARAVAEANRGRPAENRVLLCVDGVHGLGAEAESLPRLGCDFFVAGCHKWLFGPRGTGIVWGRAEAWSRVDATIPSFTAGDSPASLFTPGGYHSFEHRWALADAFAWHRSLGQARVTARIHELASRLKDGLARMKHVTLYTPRSPSLSAGIVCFDVAGYAAVEVVERLDRRRVVGTVTPYRTSYARLAPAVFNSTADVDAALRAVAALA
jgi:selenocysteine lyase/cysteine desulfurase